MAIRFKQADSAAELEQIHRLNYRTFAAEIGQHAADGSGVLVDRFHDGNTYFVAVDVGEVVGMISVNGQRPFSVEGKLADRSVLDGLAGPLLEIRLLAVAPGRRGGLTAPGLLFAVYKFARRGGYGSLVISGIVEQVALYERIGFRALGPAVGSGGARFVPMAFSMAAAPDGVAELVGGYAARRAGGRRPGLISLMPGPVEIAPAVKAAYEGRPVSHRSSGFVAAYEEAREKLSGLAGGMDVAILVGGGTTANDAVALHLRAAFGDAPGLVIVNGEFGERLAVQAARAGLQFRRLAFGWGHGLRMNEVAEALEGGVRWVWAVHMETSTGVLNELGGVVTLAVERGVVVAADCVSSLGAVPLPGAGLWMATGVSGKSLGSYPGLGLVFASKEALEASAGAGLPSSVDVGAAVRQEGPRFTVGSGVVLALRAALEERPKERYLRQAEMGRTVRSGLREMGVRPVADDGDAAPCVTTFAAPHPRFWEECRAAGFELGGRGEYLRSRGWLQIATMGNVAVEDLERFFAVAVG